MREESAPGCVPSAASREVGAAPREARAASDELIAQHRDGFPPGFTAITGEDDAGVGQGVDFGIHVLSLDEGFEEVGTKESAWVLMQGRAHIACAGREFAVERSSLFDEAPTVLHMPPGTPLRIVARSERLEWAVTRASNTATFTPRVFWPHDIEPEHRGLGLAHGTCVRNVRLVFDRTARPQSNLVVGEVINYPGRWSSYPPHHHAQPEIYHYRFSAPQGYGHGEVGDRVYKVRAFDTLRIAAQHDHAQVAAPGYAMYYLWIVRHLENNAYAGFEYSPEHVWMLDPRAEIWQPDDVPYVRRRGSGGEA